MVAIGGGLYPDNVRWTPGLCGDNTAKPSSSPPNICPSPPESLPTPADCSDFTGRLPAFVEERGREGDRRAAGASAARLMALKSERRGRFERNGGCRRWNDSVLLPQGLQAFITLTRSLFLSAPLPSLFSPLRSLPLRLSARKIEIGKKKKKELSQFDVTHENLIQHMQN